MTQATLEQTKKALDDVASKKGFRCVPVSWEDAQRGTVGGVLSCWGGNISDVRLWEKKGTLLYTLRSNNWNERLGYVASKDVAVVVGNQTRGGQAPSPVTLQRYLKDFKEYASYAGSTSEQLWDEKADQLLSIRFQAVFLPIADKEVTEFCTEVYNYNTRSDDNPRNTILLCTAQGTSVQQDGSGAKKVFIHNVDEGGLVHRYWLEAERSDHKVGGEQKETDEEAAAAAERGKATAIHIGTKAMGTRFNVQMLIQLPLVQKQVPNRLFEANSLGCVKKCKGGPMLTAMPASASCSAVSKPAPNALRPNIFRRMAAPPKPAIGVSNAARVSRGSEHDQWKGLAHKEPVRDPSQHGTITVTLYYTVAGGIPSPADVEACVADIDSLYKTCPSDKKLVDCTEVTKEMTVKEALDVKAKIVTQAYKPPTFAPNKSSFPVDD